jgi:hypothetical protein
MELDLTGIASEIRSASWRKRIILPNVQPQMAHLTGLNKTNNYETKHSLYNHHHTSDELS